MVRDFADFGEPDLESCIKLCSSVSTDPSQADCHGVSFLQQKGEFRCILLSQAGLSQSSENALAISAINAALLDQGA